MCIGVFNILIVYRVGNNEEQNGTMHCCSISPLNIGRERVEQQWNNTWGILRL